MSWYGAHSMVKKATMRGLLPARACKRCVYMFRVFYPMFEFMTDDKCDRCGMDRKQAINEITGGK